MNFMCSLLPDCKLIFSIHFSRQEMQWDGMSLLYKGMLFVCVSCKPVWRYALIIRIELGFGCNQETMVNLKLKLNAWIPGLTQHWYTFWFAFPSLCNDEIWSWWVTTLHGGTHFHAYSGHFSFVHVVSFFGLCVRSFSSFFVITFLAS